VQRSEGWWMKTSQMEGSDDGRAKRTSWKTRRSTIKPMTQLKHTALRTNQVSNFR
jgi:hypothetical protein